MVVSIGFSLTAVTSIPSRCGLTGRGSATRQQLQDPELLGSGPQWLSPPAELGHFGLASVALREVDGADTLAGTEEGMDVVPEGPDAWKQAECTRFT